LCHRSSSRKCLLGDGSPASSCWWSVYSVVVALNNLSLRSLLVELGGETK
jgi:hypothetical protein